nr:reverse transcriptase domain-containing protein [Tanacetum cinerariifolium]
MADRTMEELLQAPSEGYGEAIVIPEILAEKFEIKTNLLYHVHYRNSCYHTVVLGSVVVTTTSPVRSMTVFILTVAPVTTLLRDHPIQNKESPENSSEETIVSKTNQEPPQDSNIHQMIEECSIKVPEQQKQKIEDTMFDLVKICHHKQFLCIHDDIDNLIETIQSTKEPEHLLNMGYEHFSITPETESDEVTESNDENLLPIPSKCDVTLEDEIECDMPANDVCSPLFTTFSNPLFKDNDDLDSSDDESLPGEDVPAEEFKIYSNPLCDEDEINSDKLDPHCFNDNPLIPRPPPEPPDDNFDLEPE